MIAARICKGCGEFAHEYELRLSVKPFDYNILSGRLTELTLKRCESSYCSTHPTGILA